MAEAEVRGVPDAGVAAGEAEGGLDARSWASCLPVWVVNPRILAVPSGWPSIMVPMLAPEPPIGRIWYKGKAEELDEELAAAAEVVAAAGWPSSAASKVPLGADCFLFFLRFFLRLG